MKNSRYFHFLFLGIGLLTVATFGGIAGRARGDSNEAPGVFRESSANESFVAAENIVSDLRINSENTVFVASCFGESSDLRRDVWKSAAKNRAVDPLNRDQQGVQTRFPAVAKIVGRGKPEEKEDGVSKTTLVYGSGFYVAEFGDFGLALTNWHVVSEASESIEVVFPGFSSQARVILRDETWDLAALLIRKPPEISPIPISLETPKIGDAFWVAGYGQNAGLGGFQIQAGRLLNFVSLVEPNDLETEEEATNNATKNLARNGSASVSEDAARSTPGVAAKSTDEATQNNEQLLSENDEPLFETLAIGKGVRHGDSGGPIFNRYGEIAGILWGSDGSFAMGTFCIRLQLFLTQALEQASVLYVQNSANANFLDWTWDETSSIADRDEGSKNAIDALEVRGIYPVFHRSLYVSPDGRCDAETLLKLKDDRAALALVEEACSQIFQNQANALPPVPPVFSPTFVSQQRQKMTACPEIAPSDFFERLNARTRVALEEDAALRRSQISEATLTGARETTTTAASGDGLRDLDAETTENQEPQTNSKTIYALKPLSASGDSSVSAEKSEDDESRASGDHSDQATSDAATAPDRLANGVSSQVGNGAENELEIVGNENVSTANVEKFFSDWQIYLIVCAMFALFYQAARLFNASEKRSAKF